MASRFGQGRSWFTLVLLPAWTGRASAQVGTVDAAQKIGPGEGGFGGTLHASDLFGGSVACLGDLDGDGVPDLAVGASAVYAASQVAGSAWVLFLEGDETPPSSPHRRSCGRATSSPGQRGGPCRSRSRPGDRDPAPSVVCMPPSGSFFPLGTTLVTCTATDASGNQTSTAFPVVVTPGARQRAR